MVSFGRLAAIAGCLSVTVAIGLSASAFASGGPSSSIGSPDHSVHALTPHPPARSETIFVALTPCRIVDTLLGGGALGNGSTRNYYVGGTTGFVQQGGKSGGCGIPLYATAITATVTAPTPAGHGFLRMYPANKSEPNATVLTYVQGLSANTGTTTGIQPGVARSLLVKNHFGPTHLIIDVTGYYAPQIEGIIDPRGVVYGGSIRIVSAVHDSIGSYTVTVDGDVTNCTPTVTAYAGFVYASAFGFNGSKVKVTIWSLSPTTHVEVPYDGYFYLHVSC